MRRSDRLVPIGFGLAAALLVGFVLLPTAAIFVRVPLATLLSQLRSNAALGALGVSLRTTATSLAIILVLAVGGIVAGIAGAIVAVPAAAAISHAWPYLRSTQTAPPGEP